MQISQRITEILLDSISDGVFTVDHKWRITSFNRAAVRITGYSRQEALGQYCWDIFRSTICETDCALRRTMKQSKAYVDTATNIVNRDKRKIPVAVSTSLLMDAEGSVLGGVETFTNKDLGELVREGLFRQDLYYRVNVVCLEPPPCDSARRTSPSWWTISSAGMNRRSGKTVSGINQEALSLLLFHDYPGNMRELENIIEHAFVLCP